MTAPGWYSEPGQPHVERFWDGVQWTPQTRAAQQMQPPPPMGGYAQQAGTPESSARTGASWSTSMVVGALVSTIGVALVLFAYLTATWAKDQTGDLGGVSFDFSDLRHLFALDNSGDVPALANAYFSWLGWVLLVTVALLFAVAYLPTPGQLALRIVGVVVSGIAVLVSFEAVAQFGGLSNYLHNEGGAGFWLAVVGYAVAGAGSAISTR